MAYEANRNNNGISERERADKNNANTIKNAADVAIASKEPHAAAIGGAVKTADAATGGKSTEMLGKGLTNTNKGMPGVGKLAQGFSNKRAESGAGDKVGKAASMSSGANGSPNGEGAGNATSMGSGANSSNVGGDKRNSLPSFGGNKGGPSFPKKKPFGGNKGGSHLPKKNPFNRKSNDSDEKEDSNVLSSINKAKNFMSNPIVRYVIPLILPFLLFIVIAGGFICIISAVIDDYDDSFAASGAVGETNNAKISSKEQGDFVNRLKEVKLEYQANGKTVDVVKIVAVYNVMKKNDKNITYETMNDAAIREIADAMFSGNSYNEDVFKDNLKNKIFVKYFPDSTAEVRESMVKGVINYVGGYNSLSNRNESSNSCESAGECSYDIKGFYIQGRGNILKSYQLSNLYVRLMQCGSTNYKQYGGTWGQPMNEDLIPFEDYVLGAAYAEIGATYPEAFKAQLVISRSFALTRHIDMGGWHTLKQESDGKWVLQIAGCTADQLYCNVDKGCSWDTTSKNHLLSGTGGALQYKSALPADSSYRKYLNETEGEFLVNAQGNIIYASFNASFQKEIIELAKKGLNYKQILLQVYNQGSRNYGATDIKKSSCERTTNCISNGEYAQWKQYQGEWINVPIGNSGRTIRDIGCLVTSVSIQIARSGVATNVDGKFTPGTFVQYLNTHGGFDSYGNFSFGVATSAAPSFKFGDKIYVLGLSRSDKLNIIKD